MPHFPSSSWLLVKFLSQRERGSVIFTKKVALSRISSCWKNETHSKTQDSIHSVTPASFTSFFSPSVPPFCGHEPTICLWRETCSSVLRCLCLPWLPCLECLPPPFHLQASSSLKEPPPEQPSQRQGGRLPGLPSSLSHPVPQQRFFTYIPTLPLGLFWRRQPLKWYLNLYLWEKDNPEAHQADGERHEVFQQVHRSGNTVAEGCTFEETALFRRRWPTHQPWRMRAISTALLPVHGRRLSSQLDCCVCPAFICPWQSGIL